MNLRTYTWIALIIFLLGIGVMAKGWNRAPIKQQANQMAPAQTTPGQTNPAQNNMNQPNNSMQGGNH